MAPAVEHSPSSPPFARTRSDEDLLSLSSLEGPAPDLSLDSKYRGLSCKSMPSLPVLDVPSFNTDFKLDTSFLDGTRALSRPDSDSDAEPAPAPALSPACASKPDLSTPIVHTQELTKKPARAPTTRTRGSSVIERPRSWFPNSKPAKDDVPQRPTTSTGDDGVSPNLLREDYVKPSDRSSSVSGTFTSFAKRSWISKSRSPSPGRRPGSPDRKSSGHERSESNVSVKASKHRKRDGTTVEQADKNRSSDSLRPSKAFSRATSYFSKMKQKPMALGKLSTNTTDSDNSCASSSTSLAPPASNSTDNRTAQSISESITTVTDDSSSEMPPRTRDVLWSSFKTLEVEHKGFLSKQTGPRMVQMQQVLVPFLRSSMNHDSTKRLYPEDVDRRATILNKWWTTILEMLEGHGPQPVPGVDRPILLEAATMIMMRPEWRQTTSTFQALADRSPTEKVRARSWTNSSGSTLSDSQAAFLAESAEHNVRTMFVTNLVKQMAFVVDKMSQRHAPLSMVNFAGKACAYAFFFAPGIADILIRLWALTPELIRRTAEQIGLPRRNKGESEDIAALFPPKLGSFAWTSPKGMWDGLKKVPKLPMLVARIPWTGPWVNRWKGRDTDLFYIFCKYFFVLSEQFMPTGLPLIEKARSPGFALVSAQLLTLLDSTIHRQTAIDDSGPPLVDTMNGADAALTMPVPQTNPLKGMSENRLIILLKDFLSDDSDEIPAARHTFAEAFASMMKASTCRTSQYNHSACFTLCDFLEEALVLYSDFETSHADIKYTDWDFWFDVGKKIANSFNTMSEVRILSFIFTIWDAISKDPRRKETVCLGWLLTEQTFDTFFNHWCPMVRAYYHRLLCWRICRDTGRPNEVDAKIFLTVATRLKTAWSHFLHLQQSAAEAGRFGPSTVPVHPAPGKRFMIIRQEVNTPQPGLFLGFDSFARAFNNDVTADSAFGEETPSKNEGKKKWSILGRVLNFGGSSTQNVQEDEDSVITFGDLGGAPPPPPKQSTAGHSEDDRLRSSPMFEDQKYVFKFILTWHNQPHPSRDRVLTRPRLPAPAQSRVSSRARSDSPPPPAAGVPAPTRTISGSPQSGLISGAKNASPLGSPTAEMPQRLSLNFGRVSSWNSDISWTELSERLATPVPADPEPVVDSEPEMATPAAPDDRSRNPERVVEGITEPSRPTGFYVKNSVYIGRALAEWGGVVFECNNFLDRRRDEGVFGLSEVEVPLLGVDGFRKA